MSNTILVTYAGRAGSTAGVAAAIAYRQVSRRGRQRDSSPLARNDRVRQRSFDWLRPLARR